MHKTEMHKIKASAHPDTPLKNCGISLRNQHFQQVIESNHDIQWFEILSDNYMNCGGSPLHNLEKVREEFPVTMHSVGMSLGSTDALNMDYMHALKELMIRIEPVYVSDHLSWVSVNGQYTHDLMPLPYTEEALKVFCNNVNITQDFLGRELLIENPSSYLGYVDSPYEEPIFLNEIMKKTGCFMLLDVNNLFVSATNHGFDPQHYLAQLDCTRIKQIHLAGYLEKPKYLFDTHGKSVHAPVWKLYRQIIAQLGHIPSLIEWDTDIPSFSTLVQEAQKANIILKEAAS